MTAAHALPQAEALNDAAAVSAAYPHLVSSSPVMTSIAVILDKYRDAGSLLQRSGRQVSCHPRDGVHQGGGGGQQLGAALT